MLTAADKRQAARKEICKRGEKERMIVKLHICVSTMNHKVAHSHTHTAAAQPLQTHNRNLLLSIYLRMFTVSCHIYLFLVYNRVGFGDNKKVVIISLFSLALFRSCLYFVCSFDVFIFRVDLCISLRRELGCWVGEIWYEQEEHEEE